MSKQIQAPDMMAMFQQFMAAQLAGAATVVETPANGKSKGKAPKVTKLPAAGEVSDVLAEITADGSIEIALADPRALGKPTTDKQGNPKGRRVIAGAGYAGILLGDVLGRKAVRMFVTVTCAD